MMQIPFVAGIIFRDTPNGREFLVQTRWKPDFDPIYSGTMEFAAGVLDISYESVFDAIAREIKEETGLTLNRIVNDSRTTVLNTGRDDEIIGFRPFCCLQQLKSGRPWVGFVFLCEVEEGSPVAQESETKDVRWMLEKDILHLFKTQKSAFFGLELPAWDYYFGDFSK